MCTIVCLFLPGERIPLRLAANRDELLARPSEPPALRSWAVRVLAPLDVQAGGTWLGLSPHGFVVAITNRAPLAPDDPRDPTRRSRGLLVRMALEERSAGAAARRVLAERAEHYNGFHLLIGGTAEGHVVWGDGRALRHQVLPEGLTVVTERSLRSAAPEREQRVRAYLSERDPLDEDALRGVLRLPPDPVDPFASTWVQWPQMGYGTRSSTYVSLPSEGPAVVRHAEGAPGSPWQDYSHLAAALSQDRSSGLEEGT